MIFYIKMTLEQLRKLCLSYPGVTEDIKWEDHLCFNVGGKMFVITSPDQVPVSASFKASDSDFENLTALEGVIAAPYLARYKWVHTDDINRFTSGEWNELARRSYDLILAKLPAKIRKEIQERS